LATTIIPQGYLLPGEPNWLTNFAKALPQGAVMVELGTYKGKSAHHLALGLKGVGGTLITVDTHLDYMDCDKFIGDQYIKALYDNRLLGTIIPIIGDFYKVRTFFKSKVDAIFFDGLHEYDNISKDFANWSPLIKDGGFAIFHDYHKGFPGVKRFVDSISEQKDQWENCGGGTSIRCFKKLR